MLSSVFSVVSIVSIAFLMKLYLSADWSIEAYSWDDIKPLKEWEGVLSPNNALSEAKLLNYDQTIGAESFVVGSNDSIYTGLADGRVVELNKDGLLKETVIFIGGLLSERCESSDNGLGCDAELEKRCISNSIANNRGVSAESEIMCGRPLGLHFESDTQELFVLDAYHGLFKFNVDSKKAETVFNTKNTLPAPAFDARNDLDPVVTKPMVFLDDLTIAKDGNIYFTDASYKNNRFNYRVDIIEAGPRGRLLKYDPQKKTVETVLCGLHFPNGITELSRGNESSLLVVEMMRYRILEVPLLGNVPGNEIAKGLSDCGGKEIQPFVKVWADQLPGFGDNIEKDGNDFILGVGAKARRPFSLAYHMFYIPPKVREYIAAFVSMRIIEMLVPKYGLIVKFNGQGEILATYHDPTGKVPFISHSIKHPLSNKYLIGSSQNRFVASVELE
mmetsp:Transcript_12384/g.18571  ORF Transcript_12384/g.18571 Transcript_12384/m.18571 type:complete len:445 (-) Transcript_12384:25-1359(-)|eukprot:CAMPEP_0171457944 /NCGR_PEP_ID=MMETSP0945-20130129/3814_1 /TAXON_ID=109269 /ORGANISM="Vaucheria litorea, Strain CCMP2940" /LENGTH=444 /DNA_ID=CAMNT_0011983641 /DNA_START=91 /DNA_END=1425 /DNA_ORIENTATION=+